MKIILLIISTIFFSSNLLSKNLFETSFYEVEFTSNNIEKDKLIKINQIKIYSILEIFNNTLEYEKVNETNKFITDELTNTFIKNIIINDEKIINDKYYSKIKINFDKKKIINFFREKKIPYVEYYPKEFLLIIYEKNELNENLFSKSNSYYSYFINNLQSNKFFKIPNLDINDRFILKIKDVKNKDIEKIKNFSKKYNSNEIIIIETYKNQNDFIYNLTLLSNGEILEKKLKFNKIEFDYFYITLEKEALNVWKKINQIQNNLINVLNCKVSYYNMFELKEINSNLNNISLIHDLKVKSISFRKNEYEIYYFGNLKILRNTFELNKLKINNDKNVCNIKLK